MSINNIGTNIPIEVGKGGTGNAILTSNGVLYGNNNSPIGVTSVGTATQLLTSNGGISAPSFQNNPFISGNDFVFVQEYIGAVPFEITTGFSTNYTTYFMTYIISGATTSSPSGEIGIQLSTDGGASYLSGVYKGTYAAISSSVWLLNNTTITMTIGLTSANTFLQRGNLFLGNIMSSGNPWLISESSIRQGPPIYTQTVFNGSPIIANAFKFTAFGYTAGLDVTARIYKIRTS